MVIALHRCSYDNSTISSVNKLKQHDASLLFSLLSLFFLSLFFLICCSGLCQICQRVVLLNLLDTKVNPNCLLFHRERERERENRRSPVVREWSGGAMVLGKYSEPKRPTNLDNSRARVYCTYSRCGRGLFGHFFSRLSFLFSFSLFERRVLYILKYCLKGPLNQKQLTNQIQS